MANFDYTIHELLAVTDSVGDSMRSLIDLHAQKYPETNWGPFYEISFEREVSDLKRVWFPSVIANDPPALVPVAGFWFGLFQPVRGRGRNRETVSDFYVSGACQFDFDANSDWAVDPAYFPDGRYAGSNVLATIYREAYGTPGGPGNNAEQYLCLGYVAFALKFILADVNLDLILGSDDPVGVAVGWDSGDPLYVGFLTRDGFQVRDPQEAIAGIKLREEEFDRWFRERYGRESARARRRSR